jgi:hypothetical protein
VRKNFMLCVIEIFLIAYALYRVLKMHRRQVRQVVNHCGRSLSEQVHPVSEIFVFNRILYVLLQGLLVLLAKNKKVLPELHVRDEDVLDDGDACNQSILVFKLTGCQHAKPCSLLVLKRFELVLSDA